MAHEHKVVDADSRFTIDKTTREISSTVGYATIMQYDHNSERLTFQLPKSIDGHDMTKCNEVQVHYINIDSSTKEANKGVYEVEDLQIDPDNEERVVLTWLISGNATKFAGVLNFLIKFKCVVDGVVEYAWNTAIYKGMTVYNGIDNGEIVVEEYADILEQWRNELFNGSGGNGDGAGVHIGAEEPTDENVNVWIDTDEEAPSGGVSSWNDLTDKPFGSELAVGTVLAETSPVFDEDVGGFVLVDPVSVVADKEYTVKWNGTEYTCTCVEIQDEGDTGYALGNLSILGGDDTGEPFVIIVGDSSLIYPLDGSTELTISITGMTEIVTQLPEKYIRDSLNISEEKLRNYARVLFGAIYFKSNVDIPTSTQPDGQTETSDFLAEHYNDFHGGKLFYADLSVGGKRVNLPLQFYKTDESSTYICAVAVFSLSGTYFHDTLYAIKVVLSHDGRITYHCGSIPVQFNNT